MFARWFPTRGSHFSPGYAHSHMSTYLIHHAVGCCCRMQTGLRDVCADSQAVPAPAGKHQAEADKRHHQAENGSLHCQRRPAEESG